MFVSRTGQVLLLIRQTDHMRQVGEMGEAWGSEDVWPVHEGRDHLLCAAYQHDRGWRVYEAAPTVDPATHRPHDFNEVPVPQHVDFYRRAIDEVEALDPYAGLLVSMHGQGLYMGRFGVEGERVPSSEQIAHFDPALRAFIAHEAERQRRLRAALSPDDAELWRQYAVLQAWDRLSMFFCHGEMRKILGPVPGPRGAVVISVERLDATRARLRPFPFAGRSREFVVPAYVLPDRAFVSHADLRACLEGAAPQEMAFVAEAADPGCVP
jgi:hypothetical protein